MQEWIQQMFDKQHHVYNNYFSMCKTLFFKHLNFPKTLKVFETRECQTCTWFLLCIN